MAKPLWLQFGLDVELEQVLILGASDSRYMEAKRVASLMLPDKPLLIVNARDGLPAVWSQLGVFLIANGFPAEKLPTIADELLMKLKNLFQPRDVTCSVSPIGTTSDNSALCVSPVKPVDSATESCAM